MIKERILTPVQKFINIESFSGLLLLVASIVALIWANSPFGDSYYALWNQEIGIKTPQFEIYKPLILWINDGLMAVFFFLIGLEVKREILLGELNTMRKLAFPLIGALGGILFPVTIYLILNQNPETTQGWGIPMATDIAFALAIVKVLGDRVPLSLKVFLIAFAIVDDLGAVLVIALFYSAEIQYNFLLTALVLLTFVYLLSNRKLYSKYLTFLVAIIVWILFLKSGIHPTMAGVLMAFAIPIRQGTSTINFVDRLWQISDKFKNSDEIDPPILSGEQLEYVNELENWVDYYQSPIQKLENRLHDWVAYIIIPLFALANAGVRFVGDQPLDLGLIVTIAVALIIGKSLGISLSVFLAQRLGIVTLSSEINTRHIIGISCIAGVGFTMSIFIAGLAFPSESAYLDSAKIGVLAGSLVSGTIGYLILKSNSVVTDSVLLNSKSKSN